MWKDRAIGDHTVIAPGVTRNKAKGFTGSAGDLFRRASVPNEAKES
jgi:hypothetical protein